MLLPTQQTQEAKIHAHRGTRIRDTRDQAAVDYSLRLQGHWDLVSRPLQLNTLRTRHLNCLNPRSRALNTVIQLLYFVSL
jgi:hypothetical protein